MTKVTITLAVLGLTAVTVAGCNRGVAADGSVGASANKVAEPATSNGVVARAASTAVGEGEVRAFLERIYAPYATENGAGADYGSVIEPQLAAAIAAEEGGPGADPFIDAQDWTPFRPAYENVQVTGERAVASATFSNGGTATRIDYQLIRTPAGWRVYDVHSAQGGGLRERFLGARPGG